jgi:hypothetical protein
MTNIERERELYFYRELSRLQKMKKDKKTSIEFLENKNNMVKLGENKLEKVNDKRQSNEDNQWDINKKLLLDSFEEEEFINEAIKKYLIMMLHNNLMIS